MLEKNKILEMVIKGYAEQIGRSLAVLPFDTQQDAATVAAAVVDQLFNSLESHALSVDPSLLKAAKEAITSDTREMKNHEMPDDVANYFAKFGKITNEAHESVYRIKNAIGDYVTFHFGKGSEPSKTAAEAIVKQNTPKRGDHVTVNFVYTIKSATGGIDAAQKSAIAKGIHTQRASRVFCTARKVCRLLPQKARHNLADRVRNILKDNATRPAFIKASPEQLDRIERTLNRFVDHYDISI